MTDYKINHSEHIAVAEGYYLQPMDSCPVGVEVQLMNPGGVLTYSVWNGKDTFWQGWAPLPRTRKETQCDS